MENENLAKNPERAQDEIQGFPETLEKIEHIENRIAWLKKEFGDDSVVVRSFECDLETAKDELKEDLLIKSFKGKVRKAIKIIRNIYNEWIDEKTPDKKKVDKVKHLLAQEKLSITLKMKKLEKQLDIINLIEYKTEYDHPSGWWGYIERNFGED